MRAPASVGDDVASPCISVCRMMPQSGLCAGCFRTLDEIAAWGGLDPEAKRTVLARLPARRALHEREANDTRLAADAKR
jgi:predicted Fe-S protein YdhL (DUF1289 family)